MKDWATEHEITFKTHEDLIANQKVIAAVQEAINECNSNFGKWEQIKVFKLTPDEWSIDAGNLTPTMKMKRTIILKIYKDLYEEIYRG